MPWVYVPNYGIWPRRTVRPFRGRIIGQANPSLLGSVNGLAGEPTFTVADERPPIRFPNNMSEEGKRVHRQMAESFGVDPNQRHGFDALLELAEEDERAFKNPSPAQAQDQAEKMAETVRMLAKKGIASSVDWLTYTSPEVRNGLPTVVIGVKPSVVVGRAPSGAPLVNVRGKPMPVVPAKIMGRPVEFRITEVVALSDVEGRADDDSTAVSNNWTGTRGGWYDFSGPDVAPGGADDMGSIVRLNTDVHGLSLDPLIIKYLRANGGAYVRSPDGSWCFCLDPLLRARLEANGIDAPASLPIGKMIGWNTVPSRPLIGGTTHPIYGVHCRASSIPVEWDTVIHGTPRIQLTGGDPLAMADAPPSVEPTPLARAESLARQINLDIGALGGKAPKWWLYTLPLLKDGKPLVKVGVKGDYQPDAKELKALPWVKWLGFGVEINFEFVPPDGSGIKGTVAKITPEGLAKAGLADDESMGSAPVDTVWPTSSPDYREPTGDGTGDDDPALGMTPEESFAGYKAYMKEMKEKGLLLSQQPGGRCPPGMNVMISTFMMPAPGGGSQSICAEVCVPNKDGNMGQMGQTSHGWPARWRMPSKYAQPPIEEESGMGAAPIVAMPTGMLNWDRVSGYEGQPWVTKDWSGQNFMGGELEFDDTFMGDVGSTPPAAAPKAHHRALAFGAVAAVLGAAAGWVAAPSGDPRKDAVIGSVAGGLAGLLVGKLIGGAESTIEAAASASKPSTAPVV